MRGEAARPALGAAGEVRLGLPAAPAAILAPPQGSGRGGEGRGEGGCVPVCLRLQWRRRRPAEKLAFWLECKRLRGFP